ATAPVSGQSRMPPSSSPQTSPTPRSTPTSPPANHSASPERSPSTVSGRPSSSASTATPAPSSGCRFPPFERCCATASASAGTNSGTADCPLQNEGDPSRNDTNGGSTTTFQPEVLR